MPKPDDRDQERSDDQHDQAERDKEQNDDDKINDPLTRSDEKAPQKPFQPQKPA